MWDSKAWLKSSDHYPGAQICQASQNKGSDLGGKKEEGGQRCHEMAQEPEIQEVWHISGAASKARSIHSSRMHFGMYFDSYPFHCYDIMSITQAHAGL